MESLEILEDVRTLEHPEPFVRIMSRLPEVGEGRYIKMVHRREPYPLYAELVKRGYRYETVKLAEDLYEIYIRSGEEGKA